MWSLLGRLRHLNNNLSSLNWTGNEAESETVVLLRLSGALPGSCPPVDHCPLTALGSQDMVSGEEQPSTVRPGALPHVDGHQEGAGADQEGEDEEPPVHVGAENVSPQSVALGSPDLPQLTGCQMPDVTQTYYTT